jgi:hypothetical protein
MFIFSILYFLYTRTMVRALGLCDKGFNLHSTWPVALPRFQLGTQESEARVAQSVWLRSGRPGDRGSFPGRRKTTFPPASVQISSRAQPASCTMGTGGPFPGCKARPERKADLSNKSGADVKNEKELYLLSPPSASTGMLWDCFNFLLWGMTYVYQSLDVCS